MLLVFIVVLLSGGSLSMQLRRLLVIRPAFCGTVVTGQALFLPSFAFDPSLATDHRDPAAAVAIGGIGSIDLDGLHP
jgi:hypothetical protein